MSEAPRVFACEGAAECPGLPADLCLPAPQNEEGKSLFRCSFLEEAQRVSVVLLHLDLSRKEILMWAFPLPSEWQGMGTYPARGFTSTLERHFQIHHVSW